LQLPPLLLPPVLLLLLLLLLLLPLLLLIAVPCQFLFTPNNTLYELQKTDDVVANHVSAQRLIVISRQRPHAKPIAALNAKICTASCVLFCICCVMWRTVLAL
jgi:hypothetical protein